jgi:lipoate-protein ligase A
VKVEWRLLLDGAVDGAQNMARDRAVQLAVERGDQPPTLRLYRWERPTVTLGRFQPVDGVDLDAASELGVDVVRRYTGGRGVLHDEELTYAVVARSSDGIPRGVAASYRYFSAVLADAYRRLGIGACLVERDAPTSGSSACYLSATRADLSLGALKLSGSAQVWHGSTVLQHGSFVMRRDTEREVRLFRLSAEEARRLTQECATIESATGRVLPAESLAEQVVTAFEETLQVRLVRGSLSREETEVARGLLGELTVRSAPVWTEAERAPDV